MEHSTNSIELSKTLTGERDIKGSEVTTYIKTQVTDTKSQNYRTSVSKRRKATYTRDVT